MTRFETRSNPWLYLAIGLSLILIFLLDVITPLGYAEWVLYLVPIAMTVFMWQPLAPMIVGIISTSLLFLGYWASPPKSDLQIVFFNRAVGLITIWIVAGVCLQSIRNKLKVRLEEWLQVGEASVSACMVGEMNLHQLCDRVLQELSRYLDSLAGVIYVENGNDFHRLATFALADSATAPAQISLGQGLLGQAIKEQKSFVIQDVPAGYLSISSATGASLPQSLMICPITVDGAANGVMEFAFLRETSDSDEELLRRVAPSIGIAIKSAKYRSRLQELLEETQCQSEELQSQTEELRTTNEELEEQSRALRESQSRLEMQQAELEQTNVQLEEQSQILEKQKEDLLTSKRAVEKSAEELRRASQYKSEFLANMSHELRTPLNSSLILSKLLAENREGNLTEEQVKFAKTINSSGNDLLVLINDILDLAKIESGRFEIHIAPVSLNSLMGNLDAVFRPVAQTKSLDFEISLSPQVPAHIRTDHQRLEQILRNLLSNAIKFTARGGVELKITMCDDHHVSFAVTDTGIGISENHQQVIFEEFRQADGATNRTYGGTGLGLSISRQLSKFLGGQIFVESSLGTGSTFTLTLPIEPASSGESIGEPVQLQPIVRARTSEALASDVKGNNKSSELLAARRCRIVQDDREKLQSSRRTFLIIEDDESFAQILLDLSHEMGFQGLIGTSAEEGLELAAQYRPDAILLDVCLPGESGFYALDRFKRDPATRHVPIHVMSISDYSETALALGAVGYLLKPVGREQLLDAINALQEKWKQQAYRLLVVEDDDVQRESIQLLLNAPNVETKGVSSLAECLEALETQTFDCMILDLNLPDASGFALLETLSQDERYPFPPVIVYTGRQLTNEEEAQLRGYSRAIIIKGAKSPERLLDEVTLFLHQVVADLPPDKQRMLQQSPHRDALLQGKKVLIVEDDVRNIFAISSILEPCGIEVHIARNGLEALQKLSESNSSQPIDLVLMDLMMPEMDGLTAMREIRKRPEWKRLPMIALTAKAMASDQQHCIDAGANDYMSKPLEVEKLLSLVRVWMPR